MKNKAYINDDGQLVIDFKGKTEIVRKTKTSASKYAAVTVVEFADGSFEYSANGPNSSGIGKASFCYRARPSIIHKRMVNKRTGEKVHRECRTKDDLAVAIRQGEVKNPAAVFTKQAPSWIWPGGEIFYENTKFEVHVLFV